MTGIRRLAALASALAFLAGCGGGAGGPDAGGAAASDETIAKTVVSYFEKSVTTPGLSFKMAKLEDSEVPGWRKGTLEAVLGQQTQTVAFYVSRDGKYMFRGDAVDLSIDPLKQVMSTISLDAQPARGPADAKVTIVEYSDFQCPFCSRAYTTLETVLKDYGDKVRLVFKNFPLTSIHPWAEDAAVAAECGFKQGNDQFWVMYNGLFTKQGELNKDNLKEKATEIATAGGLDAAKFQECFDGKQTLDAVKADSAEATALGVTSTPTFFVNGRRLPGAQQPDNFKALIDQELKG